MDNSTLAITFVVVCLLFVGFFMIDFYYFIKKEAKRNAQEAEDRCRRRESLRRDAGLHVDGPV